MQCYGWDCLTDPGTDGFGEVHNVLTVIHQDGLDCSIQEPHSQRPLLLPVLQHILHVGREVVPITVARQYFSSPHPRLEMVVLQRASLLQPATFSGVLIWFEQAKLMS